MKYLFTLLIFLCAGRIAAYSQPGALDYSFGDSGKVVSTTYQGDAYASLLQPDGKIVVGGSGGYYKGDTFIGGSLLVRYNPDGSADLSFGDSGRTAYSLSDPLYAKVTYAVALQKDGRIVSALTGYESFAVMRVNSDGTVDKSYGEGGLAVGPEDEGYIAVDMALLPDGRTVITGNVTVGINDDDRLFVACFTADGKLDKSFGNAGVTITDLSTAIGIATIATTAEGKIVVGGSYSFPINPGYRTLFLRYNNDGTADKSFGVNGVAEMFFDRSFSAPTVSDVTVSGDNKIVACGYAGIASRNAFMVSRLLANGMPDSSFGTNGYTVTDLKGDDARANAVAVQPNGKIVAGGYFVKGQFGPVTLVQYNIDGNVDSSFGTNGISSTVFTGYDVGSSVLIQKDNKIVLSGYSLTLSEDKFVTTLVRYNGDGNNKQPLIVRIRRWLQHKGISWGANSNVPYYTVQRSVDGGVTYKEIAKVYAGKGQLYNYEDATAPANSTAASYRLAAIAKDGSRTYSNTVLIDESSQVRMFPNPVKDNLQLQGLATGGKTAVSVVDINGVVRIRAVATASTYSINTAMLSPGHYLLKLQHGNTITSLPFVKE